MGGTVTSDLTTGVISLCEATTGWTAAGGTNTLNSDIYVQGSACIHNYASSGASRGADYDMGSGGTNLTGQTIYCWFAFSKKENIPVLGSTGLRLRITDTSGNWGEWDIAGSDTLPHAGWIAYAVNMGVTANRNGGTAPTLSSVRYVGWRCGGTVLGKTYIYFDAFRYGTGLTISGGSSGDPANFEALYQADLANAYGVIDKVFGVFFVQGKLAIGSTSAGVSTYFSATGQVVVFKNAKIPESFYEIKVEGNSTGTTEFYLGQASGGRGISGCVVRTESSSQTAKWNLYLYDDYANKVGLYGCTFVDTYIATMPYYHADKNILSCNFEGCNEIAVNTCTIEYCNFVAAKYSRGIYIDQSTHNVANCNFINCPNAVGINYATDFDFDNLKFTGNTYDVENMTSATITISCLNGSNPTTENNSGGGDIIFDNPKVLTITNIVSGSDVVLYEAGTTTVLEDSQENSGSTYAYYYQGADVGDYIDVGVFMAGYRPFYVRNYQLSDSNSSLPVAQAIDRDYIE